MNKYTIDSAMQRLSEITQCLESGELDLEASLKIYEEGIKLISFCNKTLMSAKQTVCELSENETGEKDDE